MSDPVRWRDPAAGGPPGATELLAHARQPPALDAATRGRVGAQLASLDAAVTAKPVGHPAGAAKLAVMKGVAVVVLGAALAVGVTTLVGGSRGSEPGRGRPATGATREVRASMPANPTAPRAPAALRAAPASPGPVPASAPATADREPASVVRPRAPTTVATPRGSPNPRPPAPAEQPAPPSVGASAVAVGPAAAATAEDSLEIESRLVGEAHELLERDPVQALARIEVYARLFPSGQLAPEAGFVALTALARLGRNAEARERGRQLLQRFPRSPQAERVRRILSTIP